jgi:hypothetical protein
MLSFVIAAVFYIITSRANLQFFIQTPDSFGTSFFVASQPYWGPDRLIVEVRRSHTASHTKLCRIPLDEGSVCLHSQQTYTHAPGGIRIRKPSKSVGRVTTP